MPKASACPEANALKKLAAAEFAPADIEPLLSHLQECDVCLSRVQTLAPKDTLLSVLDKVKTMSDDPDDPAVAGLIARLSALGKPAAGDAVVAKFTFACANCGKSLKVKAELAGKKVKCPGCGKAVVAPEKGAIPVQAKRPAGRPVSEEKTLLPMEPEVAPPRKKVPADASNERTILPDGVDTKTGLSGIAQAGRKRGEEDTQAADPPEEEQPLDFLSPPQQPDELGRLSHYRILKKLGAGGMGMVFLAEDTMLHRNVALKLMLPQFAASKQARDRFLREARAAAKVEHEHIVAIHQVGEDNNVPFLAMPFLKGKPLDDYLDQEGKLPVAEALRIASEMADGLSGAHGSGLIHRDIKPGNVWLEGTGRKVKLLDFGLARSEADTKLTQSGAMVGTPAYMAPEQAKGGKIDARADLFSLGCVLYVMLTGTKPFKGEDTLSLLTALALETPTAPQILNSEVPEEVSDLTLRLLEKNPADRPACATDLVSELAELRSELAPAAGSMLASQTSARRGKKTRVGKKPATITAAKSRGWMSRAAMVLGMLVGVGALAVGGLYFGGIIRVPTAKGTLVIETDDPKVEVLIKQGGVTIYDPTTSRKLDLKVGDYEIEIVDANAGWKFSTKKFTIIRDGATKVKIWLDQAVAANPLFNGVNLDAAKIPAEERLPGQPKELVAVLGEHRAWQDSNGPRALDVCFSVDGKLLATSGNSNGASIWDATSLRLRHVLCSSHASAVAFAPDTKSIALGVGYGGYGHIEVFDLTGAKPECKLPHLKGDGHDVGSLSYSSQGKLLASASHMGMGLVWDLSQESPQPKTFPMKVFSVSFSPDGKTLATACEGGVVRLWDVTAKEPLELAVSPTMAIKNAMVRKVMFSPNGKTVAYNLGIEERHFSVRLLDVKGKSLEERPVPKHPDDNATALAFDADGTTLAMGPPASAGGGTFTFLDLSAREVKTKKAFGAHYDRLEVACYSPAGKVMASMSLEGIVKLWDITGPQPKELLVRATGHSSKVQALAFSPDGKTLSSGARDSTVRLWDLSGPAPRESAVLRDHKTAIGFLRFAPDGKSLISGSQGIVGMQNSEAFVWRLTPDGPKGRKFFDGPGEVRFATFNPDSNPGMVGVNDQGELRLWDVADGNVNPLKTPKTPWVPLYLGPTALSPDDGLLAFNLDGETRKTVRLWQIDGKSITERSTFDHGDIVRHLAFAPDGKSVVSASGHFRVWDLAEKKQKLAWNSDRVFTCVLYSTDGRMLYVADEANRLIAWDAAYGSKNQEWQMPMPIHCLAQSPDGRYLAAGNANGTIYILQVAKDPVAAVKPVESKPVETKPEEKPTPPSTSPLDALDPAQISADNRRSWLPKETVAVLGDLKGRTPRDVLDMVVSPDGKWLVYSGGQSDGLPGAIDVYEAATLRFHCELKAPPGRRNQGVAFLSNNVVCAFGALWDLSSADEPIRVADLTPANPAATATAPKASRLAARYADGSIHVWDFVGDKLKERGIASHPTTFNLLRMLPDGNTLISSDGGGSLRIWDLSEPTPKMVTELKDAIAANQTWRLAVSPDGKTLATYEKNKSGPPESVILWDLTNPKQPQRRTLPAKGVSSHHSLAFSPDNTWLAVLAYNPQPCIQLWPVAGTASAAKIEHALPPTHELTSVAFSLDGRMLFVGARHWGCGSLHVLDFDGVKLTSRWRPHDAVLGPAFSPDGQTLATFLPSGNSWWDLTGTAPRERKLPDYFRGICGFSQKGLFVENENELSEWDGKKTRSVANVVNLSGYHAMSFDGGTAAFAYPEGGVKMGDIAGRKWQKEAFFDVRAQSIFLRSDGKALASISDGYAASHLLQRDTDGWKQTWKGKGAVALSPRGEKFAVAEANAVVIFDISGAQPGEVTSLPISGVNGISFSADGSIVAVRTGTQGATASSLVVIDVESGLRLHTWQIPGGVHSFSFAPDGRHLAVALHHGVTLIVRLPAPNGK